MSEKKREKRSRPQLKDETGYRKIAKSLGAASFSRAPSTPPVKDDSSEYYYKLFQEQLGINLRKTPAKQPMSPSSPSSSLEQPQTEELVPAEQPATPSPVTSSLALIPVSFPSYTSGELPRSPVSFHGATKQPPASDTPRQDPAHDIDTLLTPNATDHVDALLNL